MPALRRQARRRLRRSGDARVAGARLPAAAAHALLPSDSRQAACHRFHEHCAAAGIALPRRTFALSYLTNIPRQAGLAGSSAITLATLRCLRSVHGVEAALPVHELPGLALEAEAGLGITAGPQDRVVQTYGGVLFMDFADPAQSRYRALAPGALPALAVLYDSEPSGKDSGGVHSGVKQRWLAGDPDVR